MTSYRFEESGKLRKPSAVELLAADCDNAVLAYTTGTMEGGRHYYAYVAVKPSMYEEFHALTSAGKSIILGDYGTVIAAGFEAEAPPEVARQMREQYGFDEHYLEKLQAEVNRQGRALAEKREEKRILTIVDAMKAKADSSDASAS